MIHRMVYADDSERMLEVKATGLGKFFPFYVTANEVRCSDDIPEQYHLFRVFDKLGVSNRVELVLSCLRQEETAREEAATIET